jgi:hypothetical protein
VPLLQGKINIPGSHADVDGTSRPSFWSDLYRLPKIIVHG